MEPEISPADDRKAREWERQYLERWRCVRGVRLEGPGATIESVDVHGQLFDTELVVRLRIDRFPGPFFAHVRRIWWPSVLPDPVRQAEWHLQGLYELVDLMEEPWGVPGPVRWRPGPPTQPLRADRAT
jgi:hypothetical protein